MRVIGTGLPLSLPADAAFSVSVSVQGALCPDNAFCIDGETKKDGYLLLSLRKPKPADDPAAGGTSAEPGIQNATNLTT